MTFVTPDALVSSLGIDFTRRIFFQNTANVPEVILAPSDFLDFLDFLNFNEVSRENINVASRSTNFLKLRFALNDRPDLEINPKVKNIKKHQSRGKLST